MATMIGSQPLNPVTERVDRVSPPENRYDVILSDTGSVTRNTESVAPAGKSKQPPSLAETLDYVRHGLGWMGTLRHSAHPDVDPYLGWGNQHALTVATLWAAHTSARVACSNTEHKHIPGLPGSMVWQATPRLGLFAATPGAGKTYLAECILRFVPNPSLQDEPTGPGLVRLIGLKHATVAIDEGDIFVGNDSRKRVAISVLNNGYRPGGKSTHAEGSRDVFDVPTYGPVIIAAIDTIETGTGDRLKALLTRFIVLRLKQAPDGYRPPRIRRADEADIKTISEYLQSMMMSLSETLGQMEAEMPSYMGPRQAEIWEPLFLIAALADSQDPREAGDRSNWSARILAAADWYCNGGEQRAVLEAGLDSVRSAAALWAENMAG